MPTYEYRCGACGHRFEEFQKMSDDPVEKCPECGSAEAERMMSAGAGLVFKGSGFYETDYKRAGRDGPGEDEAEADATDGAEARGPGDGGGEGSADGGESGAEKGGESAA